MSVFSYELNDHKVAIVTIDVPGEKMNTLRDSFADELLEVIAKGKQDDVTGMVLSVVKQTTSSPVQTSKCWTTPTRATTR